MENKNYVSEGCADLLKKAGYKQPISLYDAQKWLIDECKVYVSVYTHPVREPEFRMMWGYDIASLASFSEWLMKYRERNSLEYFSSYEDALRAGIETALRNL